MDEFADMIMFDALTFNSDRHYGNFGLMRNAHTGEFVSFAPIFDNGDSMLAKASPDAFENSDNFEKYINSPEVNISYYGVNYDKLVETYCGKNQISKLRKLLTFDLQPHTHYNLPQKRLDSLNKMIRERASYLINIITK